MRRLSLRPLITIAALGAVTGGCADNDSALFIRSVIALDPDSCEAAPQPDARFLPFGVLDVAFGDSYFANLLVGNQLARQGDRDKVRTETSRIALRGADVEVKSIDGATITSFATDGAGFVDPGSGTEPGYGIMAAELLPAGAVAPPARVNVSVRVVGETLGGADIRSSELIFPITVCSGCLVSFPADAIDFTTQRCFGEPPSEPPCLSGQDEPIDCRHCAANSCCFPFDQACP